MSDEPKNMSEALARALAESGALEYYAREWQRCEKEAAQLGVTAEQLWEIKHAERLRTLDDYDRMISNRYSVGADALEQAKTETLNGASQGGRARAEQLARDYRGELKRVMAAHPKWSVTQARERVAKTFGVTRRTVERHTK